MPKVTLNDIASGYSLKEAYNTNNDTIEAAFDNTLSRDGSTPNQMAADIDLNSNSLLNVDQINGSDASGLGANLDAVAADIANVNTVATDIANVNTVATNIADVNTVATNVADVTNFADVYLGASATDPVTRTDGSPLQMGDLYFNTVENKLRAYSGTVWVSGTSATIAVQQFSGDGSTVAFVLAGAPDSENNTQVYVDGVYQQKTTYSVSGNTLTFSEAPPAGTDNIEVVNVDTLALGETDANLVSYDSGLGTVTTVETKLRALEVTDYTALAAIDNPYTGMTAIVTNSGIGGTFVYDATQVATNNGGTIINGWVRQYSGPVNVLWFGASPDAASAVNKAAIEAAWSASKIILIPPGTYTANGLQINGGAGYEEKKIIGEGAVIAGDSIYLFNLFGCYMESVTFDASVEIFIEGLRYCNFNNVIFAGLVKWGKYNTDLGLSSWSTYWNKFTQCKFAEGIEFTLSVSDANFNSNTFDTCEFRGGSQTALMTFRENAANNGTFSSNTFIGCDLSYTPVMNIVDDYSFFAMTVIGGYLDTGTDWYLPGSFEAKSLDIIGLRNPSGHQISSTISSDIRMTTGGSRTKKMLPIGAVSLFKTEEVRANYSGGSFQYVHSVPLPWDGEYTISAVFDDNGAPGFDVIKFENLTVGASADVLGVLTTNGYSSFTFSASAGDEVRLLLDGNVSTNTDALLLTLTPGAGLAGAVPYRTVNPTDDVVVNCPAGVATDLYTSPALNSYGLNFYKVIVYTKNPATGGGGEKVVYEVGVASSTTSLVTTVTEISRTTRNGNGGTSLQAGDFALTATTTGMTFTLVGTMTSGNIASVDATVKLYPANTE